MGIILFLVIKKIDKNNSFRYNSCGVFMKKKDQNLFYYSKEDRLLLSRTLDQYRKFLETNQTTFTSFLGEREKLLVCHYLDEQKISYQLFRTVPEANKVILYFGMEGDFVTSYRVKNNNQLLQHRDILGSLFALGLTHEVIGDIFVESDFIYFSVLKKIETIIDQGLQRISSVTVHLEKIDSFQLKEVHEEILTLSVSSLRIDLIVSKLASCSRNQVSSYFRDRKVLLFYQEVLRLDLFLKTGDILSIRTVGKFRIGNILGTSKKGKMILEIVKYR